MAEAFDSRTIREILRPMLEAPPLDIWEKMMPAKPVTCWGPNCDRSREYDTPDHIVVRWYCEDCAARLTAAADLLDAPSPTEESENP